MIVGKQAEAAAVLRNLAPTAPEARVQALAQRLAMVALLHGASERSQAGRTGRPRTELMRVEEAAAALLRALEETGTEGGAALRKRLSLDHGMTGDAALEALRRIEVAANTARVTLEGRSPPRPTTGPRKATARRVTTEAARAFEELTGRPPTRATDQEGRPAGTFTAFLGEVFRAVGIPASAESQARALIMEKRRA